MEERAQGIGWRDLMSDTDERLKDYADQLGFDLCGVADPYDPVFQNVSKDHKPQDYLPSVKSIIVLGLEIVDSILQTTPSGIYSQHYDTVNGMLNVGAYKLLKWLENQDFKSLSFPETDNYSILWQQYNLGYDKFVPCFDHMASAVTSGLGTMGISGVVLTPEFGPRQRWITVLTEALLPFGTPLNKELCLGKQKTNGCLKCVAVCPIQAIHTNKQFNARECWIHWTNLRDKGLACGICIKSCPKGDKQ